MPVGPPRIAAKIDVCFYGWPISEKRWAFFMGDERKAGTAGYGANGRCW
ncbi:MAG: hypothetical protein ACE5J1_06005 [Nitrospiria bacterium]